MKPTERFSSRVENYAKYRPSYPPEIAALLRDKCALEPGSSVADIGSGTGLFAELLLKQQWEVFAVEPNQPMREAAEKFLSSNPHFHSVSGTAEDLPFAEHTIDCITAAQAFHWFNRPKARAEFLRVLKPGGFVVLIWNDRRTESTAFLKAYEQLLLDFGTDYQQINHRHIDENVIRNFFSPGTFERKTYFNEQRFDYDGVKGRLLSSSYVPDENHVRYQPMLTELQRIFDLYQEGGRVAFEYDTIVFYGPLIP